ncbi:MAG: TIGR02147 family protein [Bdellovibrionales bacterium]
MPLPAVFSFFDYKKFLFHQIQVHAAERGYKSQLAEAAGCQRSFLSQILNTHVHLTPDHALGLAQFWKLDAQATEYFLALVDHARAATPTLKRHLETRLKALKEARRDAEVRIRHPELESLEHQAIYYSHWYWSAIHMLVNTDEFRNERALADRLQMPVAMMREALSALREMGLVEKSKGEWVPTKRHLHATSGSIYSSLHHASWRSKANENMRRRRTSDVHFTGVYSLSRKVREEIEDRVLSLISATGKLVEPSRDEDVACLCIDWFDP